MADRWMVAVDEVTEKTVGVFMVHPASEYVLELRDNGLDDCSRREWCERLCVVLNEARRMGKL